MRLRAIILCISLSAFSITAFGQPSQTSKKPIPDQAEPYFVDLTAMDYAFAMPSEIKSGWVTLRFNNMGNEIHFAKISRLDNDITREEWASVDSYQSAVEIWGGWTGVGGPGFHSSGMSSEITIYLEPGSYQMFCAIVTPDGKNHRDLGMEKFFIVNGEKSGAPKPDAVYSVTLNPYHIETQGSLGTGTQTVEVNHTGGDLFDVHLVQLNDASTIDETLKFMDDLKEPTEAHFITGAEDPTRAFEGEIPSQKSYLTFDLKPGKYAWMSHEFAEMGMIREFTVSEEEFKEPMPGSTKREYQEVMIELTDDGIELPEMVSVGIHDYKLEMQEVKPDSHNVILFKLREDKSIEDYKDYVASRDSEGRPLPSPINNYYIEFDSPAVEDGEVTLNLRPGKYGVACTNWEWDHQSKHIKKGEIASFEVK